MALVMDKAKLEAFMAEEFPQMADEFQLLHLDEDILRVRMQVEDRHLRPGGTVSGPSMFALADCAFYLATLARIGPKALTVTTNCSIDFMRKPQPGALLGEARILKLGRTLSVGDVLLFSEAEPKLPVARAGLTYSIPPARAE